MAVKIIIAVKEIICETIGKGKIGCYGNEKINWRSNEI